MALSNLQAPCFHHLTRYSAPRVCKKGTILSTLSVPKSRKIDIPLPNLQTRGLAPEEIEFINSCPSLATSIFEKQAVFISNSKFTRNDTSGADSLVMAKLYAILDAVADRVEMHKNIGEQRDNWNSLLLTSINAITLAAATMSGVASTIAVGGAPISILKLSSTLMFLAATGMLFVMNTIQPSQLAEEQRNAARLFQQLHNQIQTTIAIGKPTDNYVKESMEKVLALDKAYPLPLPGVMLEKLPTMVEPAVWWPQQRQRQVTEPTVNNMNSNGWNMKLEEEIRSVVDVVRKKDKADYLRLGGRALKLNKLLAISGPILSGLAAIGSAFVGSPSHGTWAAMLGVVGGALASIVNTLEHGGQVGMLFEMYRGNAGFFKLMEETIESNLMERRENGELFEMKVALQLGRSLTDLRDLASSSSIKGKDVDEFASKLF